MTRTFGAATRARGVGHQRFHLRPPHADRAQAALRADHPAVVEGRTLFPSTVVNAADAPRLLVSGRNSAKIGDRILKGPWAGLPVFTLTLEERATCPRSCDVWRECYGNSMPMARRHRHGPDLMRILDVELDTLLALNPKGIAVRLHVLGDFYSTEYAWQWVEWMRLHPLLRVWGYTAHPSESAIGRIIGDANRRFPDRWAVRYSVSPGVPISPMQATTIWRQPETPNVPEGLVCPASMDKSAACVICGLCWAPEAAGKRIVFLGHGMRRPTGPMPRAPQPDNAAARMIDAAGGSRVVAAGMALGEQAIERWRQTGHVPPGRRDAFDVLCADLTHRQSQTHYVGRRSANLLP